MANFVALRDPDSERRNRFLDSVEPLIDPIGGLQQERLEGASFGMIWAAAPDAPVDTAQNEVGAALIIGDAFDGDTRFDAEQVLEREANSEPTILDGFHIAITHRVKGDLVVAGDRLGLFPIFYSTSVDGSIAMVGSSPELFRLHPSFPARACPRGLVGLLLAHGPLAGLTLLEGVRRLGVGCALVFTADGGAVEERRYEIEKSIELDPLDFDDHVSRVHSQWHTTLDGQVPKERPVGLLLSGGRDSRLMAGYLAELGREVRAVSMGRDSDYESEAAALVASELGFEHRRIDVPEARFPQWGARQARWEHLTSGFSNVHTWAAVPALRELSSHCVSGYLREVREISLGSGDFSSWVDGPYAHGIHPILLRASLREPFKDLVDEVLDDLKNEWNWASSNPEDRLWRFVLGLGERAHPGGVLWRFSLGSWPVLPILDRRLLGLMASIPTASVANRRLNDALLRRYFAPLARLPLDRNAHDTIPLAPTRLRRLINPGIVASRGLRTRLEGRRAERRYYRRVYDLRNAGWRSVRELAEPGRPALTHVFDPEALERLLPSPGSPIRLEHPIRDAFVPKLLLGLMLWAQDHPL